MYLKNSVKLNLIKCIVQNNITAWFIVSCLDSVYLVCTFSAMPLLTFINAFNMQRLHDSL